MSKMSTTNQGIVQLLRDIAAVLTVRNENRFRIIAYEKAADSIEHLTTELKDKWHDDTLKDISGIGSTIAAYLDELFRTGRVAHFEKILSQVSPAFFEFLLIPGIGPKKADRLTREFSILELKGAVNLLEKAAKSGQIAKLEGFGEKSQTEIVEAIQTYRKGQIKENRMPYPFADALAQKVIDYLQKHQAVARVDQLGSMRRKVATIGDIDLACCTNDPSQVVKYFVQYPETSKIIDQGEKGATILLKIGRQVDLRVQTKEAYGAMLQYFTGSKHHNITLREYALKKGLSLSEHGIKVVKTGKIEKMRSEPEFYNRIGLAYIPPEIREDQGEIERARNEFLSQDPGLPKLVDVHDIKGDLHIHSNYDLSSSHDVGTSPLSKILDAAAQLNYEYIGIADHNPAVKGHSQSAVVEILHKRQQSLRNEHKNWCDKNKSTLKLYILLEVDIQPHGTLSLPDEAFSFIDAAIVSVHSSFLLDKKTMTKRILSGLAHPKVRILGHPTGRLIGERESIAADWPEIFAYAKATKKALEINSWHQRLDLPDILVKEAVASGVSLVINTDSHAADQLSQIPYGVNVARRGWAEKSDILNTLRYNEFTDWLCTKK